MIEINFRSTDSYTLDTSVYNGQHLLYDATLSCVSTCESNLDDKSIAAPLIEDIIRNLDMTILIPPIVVQFPVRNNNIDELMLDLEMQKELTPVMMNSLLQWRRNRLQMNGWSAIAMLAESHISIHTFPSLGYVSADIYSCKFFDTSMATTMLNNKLFPNLIVGSDYFVTSTIVSRGPRKHNGSSK